MFKLPYIPTADALIDKAFRVGSKKAKAKRSTRKGDRKVRLQKSEEERVKAISIAIKSDMKAIIRNFPSYEQLPVFYQRLLDVRIDRDHYKKSLAGAQWCLTQVEKLENRTLDSVRKNRDTSFVKAFLGRVSSIVKQVGPQLDSLIEIKMSLLEFPDLQDVPTLVVAGYPNVGKSTFMGNLTGSKPKVAAYPFTTQQILIGRRKIKYQDHQIIDTPGLLDRSMDDRNDIERQAILAIKELASAILFIFDPTQDFQHQANLLKEIRQSFKVPLYVAINKVDAADPGEVERVRSEFAVPPDLLISAKNEEDCRRVFELIFRSLPAA